MLSLAAVVVPCKITIPSIVDTSHVTKSTVEATAVLSLAAVVVPYEIPSLVDTPHAMITDVA